MRWPLVLLLIVGLAVNPAEAVESWIEPVTGLAFVRVPKGCFQMGTEGEPVRLGNQALREAGYRGDIARNERPRHEACLSEFWISTTEVTQTAWSKVMGNALAEDDAFRPVVAVTWQEASEFAKTLTAKSPSGSRFRLPTEAEWEMACSAVGGDDGAKRETIASAHLLFKVVGKSFTDVVRPLPVGSAAPNAWGIHDMLGNAWEWVGDAFRADGYASHALYDPQVTSGDGALRVIRGGSYRSESVFHRCAARRSLPATEVSPVVGFRLVRGATR